MTNFWDFEAWGSFNLFSVLLASLLVASLVKKWVPVLKASLIPNSVLGGGILIFIGLEIFITSFF